MSAPNDKNTPEPLSFATFLEKVPRVQAGGLGPL